MQRLYERIEYLEQKLSAFVTDYQQQCAMAQKLQQENDRLKQKLARNAPIQTGKPLGHHEEHSSIPNYLQYVDQCIAFLERLA